MSSPEDKEKHRRRMKNRYAKDLRTVKYKQRIEEDKKKRQVKDLSHADLIRLINENNDVE